MEKRRMYLIQRPPRVGVWYFRRPIPKELQPFTSSGNRNAITVSLKTKKLTTEARKLHHAHLMESERVLEEARARMEAGAGAVGKDAKRQTARELVTKRAFGEVSKQEIRSLAHQCNPESDRKTR